MSKIKVSEYVSYKEVIRSNTALKHDIDNNPSEEQLELIRSWAENIFDPLREWVGGAVKINSIFRSDSLNARIGGSSSSQHCVGLNPSKNSYGAAGDIDDTFGGITNNEMGLYVLGNLDFDQLIFEYPNEEGQSSWIHISYRPDGGNRKQVMIATKGKPRYLPYYGNEYLLE
jgi:hypothetical protein